MHVPDLVQRYEYTIYLQYYFIRCPVYIRSIQIEKDHRTLCSGMKQCSNMFTSFEAFKIGHSDIAYMYIYVLYSWCYRDT